MTNYYYIYSPSTLVSPTVYTAYVPRVLKNENLEFAGLNPFIYKGFYFKRKVRLDSNYKIYNEP